MDDFDFLHGEWDVVNRRLTAPLSGRPDDWYEFPAHLWCRSLLDGAANIDEITFPTRGYRGCALRLFDPETRQWSIHWVDGRTRRLDPSPMVGGFTGDVGEFLGEDTWEGRPILVRFRWLRPATGGDTGGDTADGNTAGWEQAFSTDGGGTWETN
jgi:hypothetical protein